MTFHLFAVLLPPFLSLPSATRESIREKYGQALRLTNYHEEEWQIIERLSPEVNVAADLKELQIQAYEELIREATDEQERRR